MACQWTCLALLQRPNIELRFLERPLFKAHWANRHGIFDAEDEKRLAEVGAPADGEDCDIEYRIDYPHDLRVPARGKALVFATAEYGVLLPASMRPGIELTNIAVDGKIGFVTPAYWNVDAFLGIGIPLDRIFVVPLGFDPRIFRRVPGVREKVRAKLGVNGVVVMAAGGMSGNKRIDLLIDAFAKIAQTRQDVCLLLKGSDDLYGSKNVVQKYINMLPSHLQHVLISRLVYVGETLSNEQMSGLYQAADCYVAPYSAEGFGMPVLEAAACGLPVICTNGGPTDDFLRGDFAKKINSRLMIFPAADQGGIIIKKLAPDPDHLVELMRNAIDDEGWRLRAGAAGAIHVHSHFTWEHVTNQLVHAFFKMHTWTGKVKHAADRVLS